MGSRLSLSLSAIDLIRFRSLNRGMATITATMAKADIRIIATSPTISNDVISTAFRVTAKNIQSLLYRFNFFYSKK
jgi:ABC-type phosphate/phosphonate transport system substrate-binding protein